tara:strand:+ start:1634 stop:2599 length:966 start_codon:yes stop_codon:yes gene_type:complete
MHLPEANIRQIIREELFKEQAGNCGPRPPLPKNWRKLSYRSAVRAKYRKWFKCKYPKYGKRKKKKAVAAVAKPGAPGLKKTGGVDPHSKGQLRTGSDYWDTAPIDKVKPQLRRLHQNRNSLSPSGKALYAKLKKRMATAKTEPAGVPGKAPDAKTQRQIAIIRKTLKDPKQKSIRPQLLKRLRQLDPKAPELQVWDALHPAKSTKTQTPGVRATTTSSSRTTRQGGVTRTVSKSAVKGAVSVRDLPPDKRKAFDTNLNHMVKQARMKSKGVARNMSRNIVTSTFTQALARGWDPSTGLPGIFKLPKWGPYIQKRWKQKGYI